MSSSEKKPVMQSQPKPPFPEQHQDGPGLESKLDPKPRYQATRYRPAEKLRDKVALITGGDSGIGRAVAVIYAREGAHVAINYLPEEQSDAEETKRAVEAEGRTCLLLPANLAERSTPAKLVEAVLEEFGKIDILVSNAAHQNRKEKLEDLDDDELEETFQTNVLAYIRLVRSALPKMKPGSAVIVTSSETGLIGSAQLPDYSSTKGAINAFTKALAQSVIDRGIRVNAIAPGPVWTPLNPSDAGMTPEKVAKFGSQSPMGRPAQPEELAPAYVFLASDPDSSYITGIVLNVMGGETTAG
jgi:NAD(P)-dependent dehydrogenase (short-subunit alcohol dehydrogenase family)